jgi:hypothetical protein
LFPKIKRIRDLEAKLSEKEMLIHLLQRASMDREIAFGATRGLPESVSLLNRYPSQQQQSSQPPIESHLAMSKNCDKNHKIRLFTKNFI